MMGDYTRLTVDVKIKLDTPLEVIKVLKYLTDDPVIDAFYRDLTMIEWGKDGPGIEHPFFECDGWTYVFSEGCAYLPRTHQPEFTREPQHLKLKGSGSSKNRGDRYEKFLDWLRPYMLVDKPDEVVAYTEFDVDAYPKLEYRLGDGKYETTLVRNPAEVDSDGRYFGY